MASAKDIKKRIRSVSNTRKITRTMEMVATVKSKRMQSRLRATEPYVLAMESVLRDLRSSAAIRHPLIESEGSVVDARAKTGAKPAPGKDAPPTVLIVVTGNRGLCGGYNTNVLHLAESFLEEAGARGEPVEVQVAGKKGTQRFRFIGLPVAKVLPFGDDPTFAEIEGIAQELMGRYLSGEVKRVVVVSMRLLSASVQKPELRQLLPLSGSAWGEDSEAPVSDAPVSSGAAHPPRGAAKGKKAEVDFILEPSRAAVLDAVIPLTVKNRLYGMVLEARASEQFARRVAMKLATDNAEEMIRSYTVTYNRHRQAGITAQIVEVVSGADAQG